MDLNEIGFNYDSAGAHTSRSLMSADLETLLNYVTEKTATSEIFKKAIVEENCLSKESLKNSRITYSNLRHLYTLDANYPIWSALRFLYDKEPESLSLLAVLCAFGRDELLRAYPPFLFSKEYGVTIPRPETEEFFDNKYPGRFSPAMLKSLAQNINGSYTLTGHLKGRNKKIRSKPEVTTTSVIYAIYLGYLQDVRGISLLTTDFVKLLEINKYDVIEHLQIASQRGWVDLKHIGDVLEVNFPHFPKYIK